MRDGEHLLNVVFQIQQCLGRSALFGTDSVRLINICHSLLSQIPSWERQTMTTTGTAYIPSRSIHLGRTKPNAPEPNRLGVLISRRTAVATGPRSSQNYGPRFPTEVQLVRRLRFPFAASRYYGQNFSPLSLRLLVTWPICDRPEFRFLLRSRLFG